ncbi:MAG: alpha-amylase/4-alpha-glucanotransferase domain-containing protein [Spirochaetia bacterium]
MKKVKLIFGTTNSQPVGASDDDIEAEYQSSYKPFIRALYNAPHVHATLHYSGRLLQWLERNHSEFIDVLSELVGRKQIEVLGGGFYDPIFPLIPRSDRLGQIEQLTTYVRKLFGKRPRGLWVTSEVWDPMLPSLLKTSGMEYTFLSDYQFDAGGIEPGAVHTPCITEDEGKMVIVFPVSSRLRAACEAGSIDGVRDYLAEVASEDEDRVVSLLCRGEMMTTEGADGSVGFDEQWLRRLFAILEEESPWLLTATPARFLKKSSPRGRGYFPQAAFDRDRCEYHAGGAPLYQIGSAVAKEALDDGYLPGTSFRSLLTQYRESNLMYAKMHYIHILVNQIRGDKYRKQLAREELWRGQSNAAYWKGGRSGGIFSNRLRKQVYASLIEAEKVTREKGIFSPSIITVDFDMDGVSEYLYQGQEINAYVHTEGGIVFELDYLPVPWNYDDSLTANVMENGADATHLTRTYPRHMFVDHFFEPNGAVAVDEIQSSERGDFVDRLYTVEQLSKDSHRIHLSAVGTVNSAYGPHPVELHKEYVFEGATVNLSYRLRNRGNQPLQTAFATEINLSLSANDEASSRIVAGQGSGSPLSSEAPDSANSVNRVRLYDLQNDVMLLLTYELDTYLSSAPIELGGKGISASYQTSCFLPQWQLDVGPGEEWTQSVALSAFSD